MQNSNAMYSCPETFMSEDQNFELDNTVTDENLKGSKIVEFYKGKSVFLTGGTGFLGKLLIEKLLRACEDIDTIYVLVRPKKTENEHSRIDKLCSDVVFNPLRKLRPKFQHKIVTLRGDAALADLGLSLEDQNIIINKVNVIYHIAATTKFDEKLTLATAINVRATRDLMNIAKKCKNLQAFVHVSTAYANCNRSDIDEVFYKPPLSADELIALVENTPEGVILERASKILGTWPNTYTYTKAIAENAVKLHADGMPTCVFRPAIVIATYKEPIQSWIDNLYGATGIVIGSGIGLLRSMHCDSSCSAEVVPADYVINAMIASSYKTAVEKRLNETPIYNYVSSPENRVTWEQFLEQTSRYGITNPSSKAVWYFCLMLNSSKFFHYFCSFFVHLVPALFTDLFLLITGQKPAMLKVYWKILKFEFVISFFAAQQWNYKNDNTQMLWKELPGQDQKVFPFSMKTLDWEDYSRTHTMGLRTYVLKEDPSTLKEAKIKWERLRLAHLTVKYTFFLALFLLVLWLPWSFIATKYENVNTQRIS